MASMAMLGVDQRHVEEAKLAENLPLFPAPPGSDEYLGDPELLGKSGMTKSYQKCIVKLLTEAVAGQKIQALCYVSVNQIMVR